ncbi:MAG: hypothetical protein ACXVFL_15360 [Solirubrobacteraceae bacterium]
MLRRSLTCLLAACALLPAGAAARTAQAPGGVWATVNQCDTPAHPGAVGVRVAIPEGVGAPEQWARIRLQWFDGTVRAWRARPSSNGRWVRLGIGARPVEGGTTYTFTPPAPGARLVLRGVVDVQWRAGGKIVDQAHILTTAGHTDPSDVHLTTSRSSCEISR